MDCSGGLSCPFQISDSRHKFPFQALKKSPSDINTRAADMWSYAIMLWEMSTREIPFSDLTPMEAGMRIATEGLRLDISPGISPHMAKLIKICMNEVIIINLMTIMTKQMVI